MMIEKFARRFLLWLACFTACAAGAAGAAEVPAQAFFAGHCLRCHGEKQPKGEFRVDTLPSDFTELANAQRWAEVLFRINSREMPPKKEPPPAAPATQCRAARTDSRQPTRGQRADAGRGARHAGHVRSVSSTHRPVGLRLHNFDAIGQWRTKERVTAGKGANPAVNASGKLADGRAYDGPEAFKQLLVQDLDRFGEAFVEQLATFALRRAMTTDDAAALREIARASKAEGYRLKPVIERLVLSEIFQKR